MSFYLDRLKNCYDKKTNDYELVGGTPTHSRYDGSGKRLPHIVEKTLVAITYQEESYKGFQIVIVGWIHSYRIIYKNNGTTFEWAHDIVSDSDIGSYGEPQPTTHFRAYAWEIGTDYDNVTELDWTYAGAEIAGICKTNSAIKTLSSAKKKLDVRAKVLEQRERLISFSGDRITHANSKNPYNALVGEEVYIQAHGRLRKGVIVDTTGSRFIIGYVTPSNHKDIRWKTLPLSQLWVDN